MTEAIGAVRRQIAALPEDWHGADAMWDLAEVVGNAAFFVRTPASALDPFGEGWWQQRINAASCMATCRPGSASSRRRRTRCRSD
jgi:hypothetical protein